MTYHIVVWNWHPYSNLELVSFWIFHFHFEVFSRLHKVSFIIVSWYLKLECELILSVFIFEKVYSFVNLEYKLTANDFLLDSASFDILNTVFLHLIKLLLSQALKLKVIILDCLLLFGLHLFCEILGSLFINILIYEILSFNIRNRSTGSQVLPKDCFKF